MGSLRFANISSLVWKTNNFSSISSTIYSRVKCISIHPQCLPVSTQSRASPIQSDWRYPSLVSGCSLLAPQLIFSSTVKSNSINSIRMLSCGNKTDMFISNKMSSDGVGLNKPAQGESKRADNETTNSSPSNEPLSRKEKLKIAIRDYGATVLVFHVTMSLASLGLCYVLVSSGLDVVALLEKIGIGESIAQSKMTAEAGKFVVAYAVHKVFAPARITITLTATPLIVRKLRGMGILKQPKQPMKPTSEK